MRKVGWLWASVVIGGLFAWGCAPTGDGPRVRLDAGAATADASGSADARAPAPRTISLPCEADGALETSCRGCHAATPRFGAPMALVTREDLLAPSPSDPSVAVFEMSARRIADARRPMPPAGTGHTLRAEDRAILESYFASSAPPAPPDQGECGGTPTPRPGEGPESLPCTPTHTFVAHAPGDASAPFQVEVEDSNNLHRCFAFRNPFRDGEQATAWAPIIDADRVLHHWIVWGSAEAPPGGQEVFDCDVLPSGDAAFVMGWAPGGGNVVLPDDVGLMLDYEWLFLQVHYFDSGRDATPDQSGVAVCTTPTPRANTAGVLAFGTIDIDIPARARGHAESYTCPSWILSTFMRDFTIIGGAPHMHEHGTSFRSEVLRADGSVTPISVVDTWDFANQGSRDLARPIAVGRGDEVRVTCRYDNPGSNRVVFGENTQDEMCFDFMMVYPVTRWPRGIPRFCAETDGLSL